MSDTTPRIIRDGAVVNDDWTFIGVDATELPAAGKLIVPLTRWLSEQSSLETRAEPIGVWIEGADDPAQLADYTKRLPLIAIHFPKFADGRGYSAASLLRTRYGFKGELRAIGDILRDQLFYLKRVGFNAFAVRADKDMDDAVKSLYDFSETYQASVDQPQPLFRRRAAEMAPGFPLTLTLSPLGRGVGVRGEGASPLAIHETALTAKIDALRAKLKDIAENHTPATFASSFGAEDMVLIDLIAREFPSIEIFTLDTGRLPEATLDLMREAVSRYQFDLKIHRPDPAAVTIYVNTRGLNGFYDSLENRKACCAIRKVEPLKRALAGKAAWITGLRREQAVSRQNLTEVEHDDSHGLAKFNPLIDWTNEDVWAYIRQHSVPYNKLHDKGYPSIGCEPCTRAIKPGEDPRAGRWWWEGKEGQQECGLHVAEEGAASRFTPINIPVIERTDA